MSTDGPRDGATFDAQLDTKPLNDQARRVLGALQHGQWRTLSELAFLTAAPEASVSARIRDLRKPRFGGHVIERRRELGQRVWQYRLTGERVADDAADKQLVRVPRRDRTLLIAYRAAVENVRELCEGGDSPDEPPVYVPAADVLALLPHGTD